MNLAETNIFVRDFAWRLFRDAADADYLISRHAFRSRLPYEYYWNASQAIEKYCKCSLLLNGKSVKLHGHNISKLFSAVMDFSQDTMPLLYCPRKEFSPKAGYSFRNFETFQDILSRHSERGTPEARYRTYSTSLDNYDLHKFDELCFQLRRHCFPLDMQYAKGSKTYREALKQEPNLQIHRLPDFLTKERDEQDRWRIDSLKWMNYSYFPEYAIAQRKISGGFQAINSPIAMRYSENPEPEIAEALKWLIESVKLEKKAAKEIEEILPQSFQVG